MTRVLEVMNSLRRGLENRADRGYISLSPKRQEAAKMKPLLERRRHDRQPVILLAKCLATRKGKKTESAMWVKDVNEDGLRLEVAPSQLSTNGDGFHVGDKLTIQDFFYDHRGPQALTGEVRWTHRRPDSGQLTLGVQFTNGSRSAVKNKVFREFLQVIKSAA
jgi:hypothetical protein